MSVLFLDIGNTRIRWGYRHLGEWQTGFASDSDTLPDKGIEQVWVACVQTRPDIRQQLHKQYGKALVWLSQVIVDYPEFQHCYNQPHRLGVDRWLAMLGARSHCEGRLLVIDAGTALTIDVLNEHNRHQGGWIVPGLQLAQNCLFERTDKVNPFADEATAQFLDAGQNTVQCVSAGVRRQLLSLVQSVLNDYPGHTPFICGGDASWLLEALLPGNHLLHPVFEPDLIFEGMESLLCAGSFLP